MMLEQMSLSEAAAKLGITVEAARMRIRRGVLQGSKDEAGRWQVWLNTEDEHLNNEAEQAGGQPDEQLGEQPKQGQLDVLKARVELLETLVNELRSERDHLRSQVDRLITAAERRDILDLEKMKQSDQKALTGASDKEPWWRRWRWWH